MTFTKKENGMNTFLSCYKYMYLQFKARLDTHVNFYTTGENESFLKI